jgi:hypothetical protein
VGHDIHAAIPAGGPIDHRARGVAKFGGYPSQLVGFRLSNGPERARPDQNRWLAGP